MLIHCPSCRCEIKREMKKQLHIEIGDTHEYSILTSNFDEIPIQIMIICVRCYTQFLIVDWKVKN